MVWGCRGSLATPGPDTIASGGNTSCLEIRLADDSLLVLDAGTGIRALGLALGGRHPQPLHLLLTHLHLDHIEGLGFFVPLWIQEQELHLWGPPSPVASLERRIARYLSPPLFPVTLDEMPARIHFHDFPEGEFEIGSATIRAVPVIHRGPTVGLRITDESGSLAFIPDHEPYLGFAPGEAVPSWTSGYALAYRGRHSDPRCAIRRGRVPVPARLRPLERRARGRLRSDSRGRQARALPPRPPALGLRARTARAKGLRTMGEV